VEILGSTTKYKQIAQLKITTKKNLIIFHKPYEWYDLAERLRKEYGQSIMLISSRCKRELGFTVRHHKGLEPHDSAEWEVMKSEGWNHRYHYEDQVHLDFYNEAQQSFFMLKYLNN
jgi:hypothetical protein